MSRRRSPVEPVWIEVQHCTPAEQRRLLAGTPFFGGLTGSDIDDIAAAFKQAHFDTDAPIYFSGDPAERLGIVAAGMVKLVRPTTEGRDVLLDILGPGDYFGSLAVLGDPVYREDAVAHTQCCILHTTSNEFRGLLQRHPAVSIATLDLVAERLRSAQDTVEQISVYPVDQRLAATLLKLARRVGREVDGSMLIEMPLSRQDLADMTGATVETVSRVMSELRREGLIDSGRLWIAIRNQAALTELAER